MGGLLWGEGIHKGQYPARRGQGDERREDQKLIRHTRARPRAGKACREGCRASTYFSQMTEPVRRPFLRLQGITKRYGGVTALSDVAFACSPRTTHAGAGGNGAGKSSFIKGIAGVGRPR